MGASSAYELALEAIVQSTWDISLYKETLAAHNKLASANNLPLLTANKDWINSTQDEINHTLARLENDLKHNTTNCIKDGIRSSYQALGAHYRKVGDVGSAHRVFSKAREHATTALHAAKLSLASLDLALDAENFKLAQSHAAKAQGALDTLIGSLELKAAKTKTSGSTSTVGIDSRDLTEKDIQRWSNRVNVVNALTSLAQGDFGRATSYFLKVGKDSGESTGGELLATATDIAIYTTLCGLAHFDQQQLKDRLINNLEFRSMLDSEPQLRRILNLFRENKYRGVFEYLKASLAQFSAPAAAPGPPKPSRRVQQRPAPTNVPRSPRLRSVIHTTRTPLPTPARITQTPGIPPSNPDFQSHHTIKSPGFNPSRRTHHTAGNRTHTSQQTTNQLEGAKPATP
ncbi:hypothetical protein PtB15_10B307 [Puccinia triticina]|nr:hypothetical protein PtB15_10B307 [Puccinia triticina]